MSWVALVAGAASLGMALAWAYILIFYGGPALLLIVIALLLAVLAIALGAICLGSLQKKPSVRRGLVAVILGVFFFVWPFIALFHYIIIDAFS